MLGENCIHHESKSKEDVCTSLEDVVYSSNVSIFAREGNLNGVFLDYGPSSNWVILTPDANERIYSEYTDCDIPFMSALSRYWVLDCSSMASKWKFLSTQWLLSHNFIMRDGWMCKYSIIGVNI